MTNPERFQPLHAFALDLVDRLRSGYQVSEREAFDLLPGRMHAFDHARPPVTLTPMTRDAAPIAIGFTRFPSLVVRCGRWFVESFPDCGCDGCAATAEREIARLEEVVGDVVAGRFSEELRISWLGNAHMTWQLGSTAAGHYASGGFTIRRDAARALRAAGKGRVQWRPWPPREGDVVIAAR